MARNHVWRYTLRLFHTFAIFEKNRKINAKRTSKVISRAGPGPLGPLGAVGMISKLLRMEYFSDGVLPLAIHALRKWG